MAEENSETSQSIIAVSATDLNDILLQFIKVAEWYLFDHIGILTDKVRATYSHEVDISLLLVEVDVAFPVFYTFRQVYRL